MESPAVLPSLSVGSVSSGSAFYRRELEDSRAYVDTPNLNQFAALGKYSLDRQDRPVIDTSETILTQCGLSTLSECISRRKKMLLLPINSHPEQLVNAAIIIRLGLGTLAEERETIGETLSDPKSFADSIWPSCGGADYIAAHLLAGTALK